MLNLGGGSRHWVCAFNTTVRKAFGELAPTTIINWNSGKYGFGGERWFSKLNSNDTGIIYTHSQTGRIYLLDMPCSGIVAWTSVSPSVIHKTYIQGNIAVVLDTFGIIRTISFIPLVDLLQSNCLFWYFVVKSKPNQKPGLQLHLQDPNHKRDLVTHLNDKDKVLKVKRLTDAMDT